MKYKVCVVTGSRAEYGLLRPLLHKLNDDNEIILKLLVTGSHLSSAFGSTYSEIESDGFQIYSRIEIPMDGDSKADMARAAGFALSAFADCFEELRPDLLIILGDRFEIFAAASAAAILGIRIAHISGGDVTEGALDDTFRHCITKMSHLHFPGCKQSAYRIIQLGENPENVFNVGELGLENCLSLTPMTISELQSCIDIDIIERPYAIVTFHPETVEENSARSEINELIMAMESFPEMNFIITKANADAGGRTINLIWDEQAKTHPNWLLVSSLGVEKYIAAMKYSEMVIGNSSSGIVEAPALRKPTVNIGDRQKGRKMARSVICCKPLADEIFLAMKRAQSAEFNDIAAEAISSYGDGSSSQSIYSVIKNYLKEKPHNIKKKFYDIKVDI